MANIFKDEITIAENVGPEENRVRNAELIAAAPEMLEALLVIAELKDDELGFVPSPILEAIEKATGLTWNQVKERIDD